MFTRDWKFSGTGEEGFTHGARLTLLLRGERGVIQFVLRMSHDGEFEPWDLGSHTPWERADGTHFDDCDLFPDGQCWYDGSSLLAEDAWRRSLVADGDGIWREMEECYRAWIEDVPA